MPTTYHRADDAIVVLLQRVMHEHHRDLHDAGVLVGVIACDNPDGDAVKHRGSPAFACVKLVGPADRVFKPYDAELRIDIGKWDDLRPGQRRALLDHELSHLRLKKSWRVPVLDANQEPTEETELRFERDDTDRPKLKLVTGDWDAGDGFFAVVARHGADAIEYENIARAKAQAERARTEGERGLS